MKKFTPKTRRPGPPTSWPRTSRAEDALPEAFTEGKVDFEVLKQLLGGVVDEREEKFGLNWHGKRQARQFALTPSIGTLRPRKRRAWTGTPPRT